MTVGERRKLKYDNPAEYQCTTDRRKKGTMTGTLAVLINFFESQDEEPRSTSYSDCSEPTAAVLDGRYNLEKLAEMLERMIVDRTA